MSESIPELYHNFANLCARHKSERITSIPTRWGIQGAFGTCSDDHNGCICSWQGDGYACMCGTCREVWFVKEPFGEHSEVVKS